MKSFKKIIIASAALMMAFAFCSCTTDSQIVDIGQFATADDDLSSSSIDNEKSSSSKKVSKEDKGDKDKVSSSSVEKKDKSSSSAKEEEVSSDDKADDVSSSSVEDEAKSSSSARRIPTPGLEESGNKPKSSSSKAEVAENPESSDTTSTEDPAVESTDSKDNSSSSVTIIEEKDRDNTMTPLDSNEQKEIEDLINGGDTTIVKVDSLKIESDSLDFENNEYLCKAPDGSWYRINENKIKTFWKLLWNGIVKLFTGHNWYDFRKVCDEIYIRPISSAE